MDKKFGYYVFGGMLIGAFLGLIWGVKDSLVAGLSTGALIGTFIGWFVAAALMKQTASKKEK